MSDEDLKQQEHLKFVVEGSPDHVDGGPVQKAAPAVSPFVDPFATNDNFSFPEPDDTRDAEALVGTTIAGRFEILSVLGSGGMSTVYKARHLLLDRVVAVKFIHGGQLHARGIQRFQQEAKTATALNHPNIAAVREFGQDEQNRPYLVMDFVEGISLQDAIDNAGGKLPVERVQKVITQVCDGLKHAHDNGVIHRDLKPANIIIARNSAGEETAKIVDFGIAKLVDEEKEANLTQTGEVFGTPNYMSPEQCLGKRADKRSDIYSMGCVTFECLTGLPPFVSESALQTLMSHVNDAPDFSTFKWPPNLHRAVQGCLEKKPEDRWQKIEDFKQCIEDPSAKPVLRHQKKSIGVFKLALISVVAIVFAIVAAVVVVIYPIARPIFLPNEWEALSRKAATEKSLGPNNFASATSFYWKAVRSAEKNNAPIAQREAIYLDFARHSSTSGNFDTAIKFFNKALEANLKHRENFDRGSIHEWLSDIYNQRKQFKQGLEHAREAVAIKKRVLGKYHDYTVTSLFRLAQALEGLGQYSEAEKVGRETLEIVNKLYPNADSEFVPSAEWQLGSALHHEGKFEEAAEHYIRATLVSKTVLGPDNSATKNDVQKTTKFLKTHMPAKLAEFQRNYDAQ